jgi:hypothetical protein
MTFTVVGPVRPSQGVIGVIASSAFLSSLSVATRLMRRAGAVAICGAVTFACIHLIPLLPQFIAERAQSALATMMPYFIFVWRCIPALGTRSQMTIAERPRYAPDA